MAKSISVYKNKGRGRPKREGGVDPMISTRFPKDTVEAIEAWAVKNNLGRSEAIRRLVVLGLTVRSNAKQPLPAHAARAKELARTAIDKMADTTAPPEVQEQRRRRLTKGPMEFREGRVDQPSKRK